MIVDAGFFNEWQYKGHVLGECMSHPTGDLMYVNIPKNASSWTKPNLKDWGWEFFNYHTDKLDKTAIVVLRDPVDRWLSGIAEYFTLYHSDKQILSTDAIDIIFDRVCFDDHTDRQVKFIHGLDTERCVFFKCDKYYREDFSTFLDERGMTNRYHKYDYQHVSKDSEERRRFKKIFTREIENPKYLNRIKEYYEQDYKLINSLQFYGSR